MTNRNGTTWLGRILGEGENPLTWSLPVGSLASVAIRLHLIFVVFIAVRLVQSIQTQHDGLIFQLGGLLGLLFLVSVHEAGHVVAARRRGVAHDRVVLWPLGGLSHGDHPDTPTQLGGVALAGPMINAALLLVLAPLTLWATGSWEAVFFDPFAMSDAGLDASAEGLLAWGIWSLHASNAMLLLFNLLPMHPFDAGRLLQALLWKRGSETGAARISGLVGCVVAAMLAGLGLVINESVLVGIALVGCFVSWQEIDRARFLAVADVDWPSGPESAENEAESTTPDAAGPDDREVDLLLAKISEHGLGSLSDDERRRLDQASAAEQDL